jgi:hypothetical protein
LRRRKVDKRLPTAGDLHQQLVAEGRALGMGEPDPVLGEPSPESRRSPRRWSPASNPSVLTIAAIAVVVVVVVALATGGATATKDFLSGDGSRGAGPSPPKALAPVPRGLEVAQAMAHDPDDKYGWGLRSYPSESGQKCVVAGRLVNGRVGRLIDGKFAEMAADMQGLCGDLRRTHYVFTTRRYPCMSGGRTLLYGITDRLVLSMSLSHSGRSVPVPIAPDGSFILVRRGAWALHGTMLHIVLSTGAPANWPLQVLPDREKRGC